MNDITLRSGKELPQQQSVPIEEATRRCGFGIVKMDEEDALLRNYKYEQSKDIRSKILDILSTLREEVQKFKCGDSAPDYGALVIGIFGLLNPLSKPIFLDIFEH
ncbi:hypothetical protein CR513_47038, partial [Mucuna pruriens]